MGLYLNPGNQKFKMGVESNVFVDKSEMLLYLNSVAMTNQRYLSVSRPRRFGKTMAADMICAYYGRGAGGRELFEGLKVANAEHAYSYGLPWDAYIGRFDVVRVTMTEFLTGAKDVASALEELVEEVLYELAEAFPGVRMGRRRTLATAMARVHASTGVPFVIVIDEWDAPFRERPDDDAGQRAYLDFLRDWLKDREFVALAYMTGILPIKKYGKHSALNMFDEYSMVSQKELAPYTGFTSDEVKALCDARGLRYDAMRNWYDGYRLSNVPSEELVEDAGSVPGRKVYEIYNPLSVVSAVHFKALENYWSHTETYQALERYILMDFDGLKQAVALMMDGGRVSADLGTYQNDMSTFERRDDVLALLVHFGYLGWDSDTREAFIPNREIMEVFRDSTKTPAWDTAFSELEASKELVRATWDMDEQRVAEMLEAAHDRAANRTYNDEAALSYAVQLAYYAARKWYTTVLELDSGKGYADVCYLPAPSHPEVPALVVELKHGKGARTALDQIRERDYPDRLAHYAGNLLLVGVSYERDVRAGDPSFKRHSCRIERV